MLNILNKYFITKYLRLIILLMSPISENLLVDKSKCIIYANYVSYEKIDKKLTLADSFFIPQQYLATYPNYFRRLF
jgi:hypothetical protein